MVRARSKCRTLNDDSALPTDRLPTTAILRCLGAVGILTLHVLINTTVLDLLLFSFLQGDGSGCGFRCVFGFSGSEGVKVRYLNVRYASQEGHS